MKRAVVLATLTVLAAARVESQSPFNFSLAGGGSLPTGSFQSGTNVGWHALASVGLSTLMQPIGLRLDAAHNRFTPKSVGPERAVTSATLNVTYRLPMTNSPLSPYVITGAGAYRLACVGTVDCRGSTRFGWNAGVGTKLAAFGGKWFVESRFHAVNARSGNVRFVPLTIGLTFGD